MKLTSAQRALIRRRTRIAEHDPREVGGELNVVPFLDIVVNLIMFLLVTTASVMAIAQVEAQLPAYGPPCRGAACPDPGLRLGVTLTEAGIVVAGSGGRLAPGCADLSTGPEPTVPRRGRRFDFEALSRCAAKVKERFPMEREVVLGADPTIPYEDLVGAMDALRHQGDTALFPEVIVSAGVR